MGIETFTSFKDCNLHSKKNWLYSNDFVFYMGFITPFIALFLLFDVYNSFANIKKYKYILLVFIISITYIISDLITAFFHCYFIDNSFSEKKYKIEDGHIVINTTNGYASCHHIFPSNWKDVSDYTILITALSISCIPILLTYFCIHNLVVKLFIYFMILFFIFAVYIHKYSHEKIHNRYVPYCINILLEKNIFLSPKKHQKHHIENNYNWSLLNGSSDDFFNSIIYNLCYYLKKCPIEESVNNAKNYINENNGNIVNIKFVGDIEGVLKCKLYNNLFIKPT